MRISKVAIFVALIYLASLAAVPVMAQLRSQTSGAKSGSKKDTGATAFFISNLEKGVVRDFRLNKRALPVTKISVLPAKSVAGELRIHVRRTYEFPTRSHPKVPDAHSYFEINTVNFRPEYVEEVGFEFLVQKSWLDVRRLEPGNVSMYRLVGEEWKELPTEFNRMQGTDLVYSSESPGFSYFGIASSGFGEEDAPPEVNETLPPEEALNESYEEPTGDEEEVYEEEVVFDEGFVKYDARSTLVYWAAIALIMVIFYVLSRVVKEK